MAATSPYARAQRCFAVARSATFAGERAAAIGRGTAIAEAAGLSLDLFDIPDRVRGTRSGSEQGAPPPRVGRSKAPERYDGADTDELLRSFRAHMRGADGAIESFYATMRRREQEAGARDGETVYDARRRNFDEATAAARDRDQALGTRS